MCACDEADFLDSRAAVVKSGLACMIELHKKYELVYYFSFLLCLSYISVS